MRSVLPLPTICMAACALAGCRSPRPVETAQPRVIAETTRRCQLPSERTTQLIPYFGEHQWGFAGVDGQVVIPPRFDRVYPFVGPVALIRMDDLWGTIDERGEWLLAPNWLRLDGGYSDTLIAASAGHGMVVLDHCGEVVLPGPFTQVEFAGDLVAVSRQIPGKDAEQAVFDVSGEFVFGWHHGDITLDPGGAHFRVEVDEDTEVRDREGEFLLTWRGEVGPLVDGRAIVRSRDKDGELCVVDREGAVTLGCWILDRLEPVAGTTRAWARRRHDRHWGYIDYGELDDILVPFEFDQIREATPLDAPVPATWAFGADGWIAFDRDGVQIAVAPRCTRDPGWVLASDVHREGSALNLLYLDAKRRERASFMLVEPPRDDDRYVVFQAREVQGLLDLCEPFERADRLPARYEFIQPCEHPGRSAVAIMAIAGRGELLDLASDEVLASGIEADSGRCGHDFLMLGRNDLWGAWNWDGTAIAPMRFIVFRTTEVDGSYLLEGFYEHQTALHGFDGTRYYDDTFFDH